METLAIIQGILYFAAFLVGAKFFMFKKSPLYFKLLFFSVVCFLLEVIYNLVDFACTGAWSGTFSFATFGTGAGYLFMLSANYGQFDSFVDDGSDECGKARKLAFLAPIILAAIYIVPEISFIKATGNVFQVVLLTICKLPAFFAVYYHFKHLILPDVMHFLVDSLRPCNAVCLGLIFTDILSDGFYACGYKGVYLICEAAVPFFLLLMMIAAERGRREWKI